ncbi:MAG: hypothetical protein Tsb005_07060 [Gammaproteobacteria bacterium]
MAASTAGMLARLADNNNMSFKPDNRPSYYIYALLSQDVYQRQQPAALTAELSGWYAYKIYTDTATSFHSVLYHHQVTQQLVLAIRGTVPGINQIGFNTLVQEDFQGVFLGNITAQVEAVYNLVKTVTDIAIRKNCYLSCTGHSLGGYLATMFLFYCVDKYCYYDTNAVVIDAPSAYGLIAQFQSHTKSEDKVNLANLDYINIVSYPDIVTMCRPHEAGTLYHVKPLVDDADNQRSLLTQLITNIPLLGNYWRDVSDKIQSINWHTLEKLVSAIQANNFTYMRSWPTLKSLSSLKDSADFQDGQYQYPEIHQDKAREFAVYSNHFKSSAVLSQQNVLPLRHFSKPVQTVLGELHRKLKKNRLTIEAQWRHGETSLPESILGFIKNFEIVKENELCAVKLADEQNVLEFRTVISNWLAEHSEHYSLLLNEIKVKGVASAINQTNDPVKWTMDNSESNTEISQGNLENEMEIDSEIFLGGIEGPKTLQSVITAFYSNTPQSVIKNNEVNQQPNVPMQLTNGAKYTNTINANNVSNKLRITANNNKRENNNSLPNKASPPKKQKTTHGSGAITEENDNVKKFAR